jgi:hypothetical protein
MLISIFKEHNRKMAALLETEAAEETGIGTATKHQQEMEQSRKQDRSLGIGGVWNYKETGFYLCKGSDYGKRGIIGIFNIWPSYMQPSLLIIVLIALILKKWFVLR